MDGISRPPTRARSLRFTTRGWVTLVAGIASVVVAYSIGRRELLVIAGACLLLSLGGLLISRLRRPQLDVVRLFSPAVISAGGVARVTVRVRNKAATASTPLVWRDHVPWQERPEPRALGAIAAGSTNKRTVVLGYDLHPPRRGLYLIGPLVIANEDPFGMARSTMSLGLSDRLTVVPAVAELPQEGPVLADGEGSAQLLQRRVSGNDDDLSTREYRPGDALRRVHWRASARHGELMVRQEEHRSHPDARLIIDTRFGGFTDAIADQNSWPRVPYSAAFEWSVRMMAALGVHLDGAGFHLTVVESASPQIDQFADRRSSGRRSDGFLISLAGLHLVERQGTSLPAPPQTADSAGPIFALLGEPEPLTVGWVTRQRQPGQLAIAFLSLHAPGAAEQLRDNGWRVIQVDPASDPENAWRTAALEAGYARGAH